MPSVTPYAECLERVRSVLVFFTATGRVNAAVLAELESEVRATVRASRLARLSLIDVEHDVERLAAGTLPASSASSAVRAMRGWITMASRAVTRSDAGTGNELET